MRLERGKGMFRMLVLGIVHWKCLATCLPYGLSVTSQTRRCAGSFI